MNKKLTFILSLTFLFLFSGSVYGDDLQDALDALVAHNRQDYKTAHRLWLPLAEQGDKFAQYFIKKCPWPKVIDADALKSMGFKDFQNSIITPHETELEMMLANSGKDFLIPKLREAHVKEKAEILQGNLRYFLQNNNVLLLKGPTDIIISRNKISYNRTGNQGMTKGGTGDVLAGLAVGFLAKSQDLFKSAVAAAYLNGLVGDMLLKKKKGYSFIASDIVEDLKNIDNLAKKQKRRK